MSADLLGQAPRHSGALQIDVLRIAWQVLQGHGAEPEDRVRSRR